MALWRWVGVVVGTVLAMGTDPGDGGAQGTLCLGRPVVNESSGTRDCTIGEPVPSTGSEAESGSTVTVPVTCAEETTEESTEEATEEADVEPDSAESSSGGS